jgi:hypothetical protein
MKKKISRVWYPAFLLLCAVLMLFTLNSSVYAEETTKETGQEKTETADGTGQKKTETAVKTRKGNCDDYIGLSGSYWVLATAKKTVKVYKKADTGSKVLGKFTKNNCIVVNTSGMKKGVNYRWLKVYLKNKKTGYIKTSRVTLDKLNIKNFGLKKNSRKNKQRIQICRYALPYMGTNFVLGGSSLTRGIDCSTLARKAMRNAGVKVSSNALAVNLSNMGKKIKRSQLKPGDMVFYYDSAKVKRIGHCAIYIGNGYIINASGAQGHYYPSGGIRISKIDYRTPTAVKFRNLVGN